MLLINIYYCYYISNRSDSQQNFSQNREFVSFAVKDTFFGRYFRKKAKAGGFTPPTCLLLFSVNKLSLNKKIKKKQQYINRDLCNDRSKIRQKHCQSRHGTSAQNHEHYGKAEISCRCFFMGSMAMKNHPIIY